MANFLRKEAREIATGFSQKSLWTSPSFIVRSVAPLAAYNSWWSEIEFAEFPDSRNFCKIKNRFFGRKCALAGRDPRLARKGDGIGVGRTSPNRLSCGTAGKSKVRKKIASGHFREKSGKNPLNPVKLVSVGFKKLKIKK